MSVWKVSYFKGKPFNKERRVFYGRYDFYRKISELDVVF